MLIGLLLRLLLPFLFLLGFPLDVDQFLGVLTIETWMVEVIFRMMLPYFVKVVHVELSEGELTCRTKEE